MSDNSKASTVERNDIDISKLFTWGSKFAIMGRDSKEVMSIYMRLVGDAELNRARVFAIRSSSELRKSLKTKDSDERIAMVPELNEFNKEQLINAMVIYNINEFTKQAIEEANVPYPVEPDSDASLEEQEKYQAKVDSFDENRTEEVRKIIDKKVANLKKSLESQDESKIAKDVEELIISQLCETRMIEKFREYCAYAGSYKDKNYKTRLFQNFDEFDNLIPEIKNQFIEYYTTLEIGIPELKK